MKNAGFCLLILSSSCLALAGENVGVSSNSVGSVRVSRAKGLSVAERIAARTERRHGGWLVRPNSGKGFVQIVNRQIKVGESEIALGAKAIEDQYRVMTRVVASPDFRATVSIEIASLAGKSPLIFYPDELKVVIDVDPLQKDSSDAKMLSARIEKEIVRAFGFLLGGYVCYEKSPMAPLMTLHALDEAELDLSIEMRFQQNAAHLGIKPYERVTYQDACQEGWAPAPTNKWQKAIWDKVHEIPAKPLKIKFDPKKR